MSPSDYYVKLNTVLDETESDEVDIIPNITGQRPRRGHSSQRIALFALTLLCIAESLVLFLIWLRGDLSTGAWYSPATTRYFNAEQQFRDARTEVEVERAWSAYNLPSMGFVHIPDPAYFNLKPNSGVVKGVENVYMISAMHQLHCLEKLQTMFVRLRQGAVPGVNVSGKLGAAAAWEMNHQAHCFDYLRQGVICAADGTLESPDEGPEAGQSPLRGWGVAHTCRSWDGLMAFRREHAVPGLG
ncbi:protein of unknown function (DUF3328) domain containing protein [Naviculisporaceae sp. PSN 640]